MSYNSIAVLHISDLHFSKDQNEGKILAQKILDDIEKYPQEREKFKSDLTGATRLEEENLYLQKPNFIIVSGDLTDRGHEDEFKTFREFIRKLMAGLNIGPDKILCVPGNHDVAYIPREKIENIFQKSSIPGERVLQTINSSPSEMISENTILRLPKHPSIEIDGRKVCSTSNWLNVRLENLFKILEPEEIVGGCCGDDDWTNLTSYHRRILPDAGINFFGFNSACIVDNFCNDAFIFPQAIDSAKALEKDKDFLNFIVTHHGPLADFGERSYLESKIIENITHKMEPTIWFHGHLHRDSLNPSFHRFGKKQILFIGAGTLGNTKRTSAVNQTYNLMVVKRVGEESDFETKIVIHHRKFENGIGAANFQDTEPFTSIFISKNGSASLEKGTHTEVSGSVAAVEQVIRQACKNLVSENKPQSASPKRFIEKLKETWKMGKRVPISRNLRYDDPIYGAIEFDEIFWPIIQQPIFQRLHYINQLSFSNFGFPGATHTRLAHSMGTGYLAGYAMKAMLKKNKILKITKDCGLHYDASELSLTEYLKTDEKELINTAIIAGLLHDVGHGPFGHALDNVLQLRSVDGVQAIDKELTLDRIKLPPLSLVLQNFGSNIFDRLKAIFSKIIYGHVSERGSNFDPVVDLIRGLIDGPLDIDRLDYVQRDGIASGLARGHVKALPILDGLIPYINLTENGCALTFDISRVQEIEHFVYVRNCMYRECYEAPLKSLCDRLLLISLEKMIENLSDYDQDISSTDLMMFTDDELINFMIFFSQSNSNIEQIARELCYGPQFQLVLTQTCKDPSNPKGFFKGLFQALNEREWFKRSLSLMKSTEAKLRGVLNLEPSEYWKAVVTMPLIGPEKPEVFISEKIGSETKIYKIQSVEYKARTMSGKNRITDVLMSARRKVEIHVHQELIDKIGLECIKKAAAEILE